MAGKKGCSGRKRSLPNTPDVEAWRVEARREYYNNREYKLLYGAERHKRIVDYCRKYGVSFKEAVKKGVGRKDFRDEEQWKYLWE